MSDAQSEMHAALEEAQRADQKKREAAKALQARRHEYETANLRGRQKQISRARAALEAGQAAFEAAKRDVQRLYDRSEEVVQAQVSLGRRTRNSGGSAAARSAARRETLRPGRTPGHSRQVTTPAGRCATIGRGRPERRLVRDPAPKANDRCLFGLLRFAATGRVERDAPILDLLQPRTNKSNRPLAVIAAARNSDTSAAWTVPPELG